MKKITKIIVPVLLAIAVVSSIVWYLFQYDPDFTQDFLLSRARVADERGNHKFSAWCYDLAYRQSGEDENVAIELAEQFKSIGNYTKAEYTLSNAISDGGSAELYIALCKTYLEQDKLLDAVTMLDNIADPAIKAELDAQRPAAPAAEPADGYYNEYIDVSLAADGQIYMTTNKEYPSTKQEPFSGVYTLPGGETTIYALAIGDSGLVSPLTVLGYTVAGVIEEVTIQDPGLDAIVRQQLDVSTAYKLYTNQLWSFTELELTADVTDCAELAKFPFLESLTIPQGKYSNLSTISSLTNLKTLSIDGVTITTDDLKAICALPDLTGLYLTRCNLSGISELSNATGLTELDLSNNTIRDLEPLSKMQDLTYLNMSHNAVTQLTALTGLTKLTELDVSYNSVNSTVALSGCKALNILRIDYNALTKLEGLGKLEQLQIITASHNQINDITDLSSPPALSELDLSNNNLTNLDALASQKQLRVLNFAYNQVAALPAFVSDCQLININGTRNQLTNLQALSVLKQLNYATMDYNTGITSVSPLASCYNLVEVSVYGTGVTDVSALVKMDVIVKYAPVGG